MRGGVGPFLVPGYMEDSQRSRYVPSRNIECLTCYILEPVPVTGDMVANRIDISTFLEDITGRGLLNFLTAATKILTKKGCLWKAASV